LSSELGNLIFPALEHFQGLGYWIAFAAALAETALVVGLFIPGSTTLLFMGAFAAGGQLDFTALLWFAIAGAILGDNLNYWLGRRYGQRWTKDGVRFLQRDHFDSAREFLDRHGARSVFLGRFVPTVKELVPFVAGAVHMRRRTFMFWNVLGAIGWGFEWLGAGYLLAHSLNLAQLWLSRAGLLLAAILVASLLLLWFRRFIYRYGQAWLQVARSVWHSIRQAVATNPEIVRMVGNHPRLFSFLASRLDRQQFSGLPLTLSGLAFAYVLVLFGGIVEDLLMRDPVVAVDHSLAQLVATMRTDTIVQVFIWVTQLGKWQVVATFLLATATLLWLSRRTWMLTGLLASTGGGMVFTALGKLAFHRPRPAEAILLEHSYSFPSGHATVAVAFYGFLCYLLVRSANSWRARVNWLFVTLALILLIGLSRIILGVHYLSDVWAGYLAGALWLIIGISLTEWLTGTGRIAASNRSRPVRRPVGYGLIGLAVCIYAGFAALYPPRFASPAPVVLQHITGDPIPFLKVRAPAYTETAFGQRQLPLSMLLIALGTDDLENVFLAAGWQHPEAASLHYLAGLLQHGRQSGQTPLAPGFWNGRINTLAFEKTLITDRGSRVVAIQLWDTSYITQQGRLFIATARAFDGTRWGVLRSIDPDLDSARAAFIASLRAAGVNFELRQAEYVEAVVGQTLTGEPFFSRGEIILLSLAGSAVQQ